MSNPTHEVIEKLKVLRLDLSEDTGDWSHSIMVINDALALLQPVTTLAPVLHIIEGLEKLSARAHAIVGSGDGLFENQSMNYRRLLDDLDAFITSLKEPESAPLAQENAALIEKAFGAGWTAALSGRSYQLALDACLAALSAAPPAQPQTSQADLRTQLLAYLDELQEEAMSRRLSTNDAGIVTGIAGRLRVIAEGGC